MIRTLASALALTAAFWAPLPLTAQDASPSSSEVVGQTRAPALAPGEIIAQARAEEWVAIPAEDLLVMTLAPDTDGNPRQVVIQLVPAPFSQGWVHNIRLFARSGWYDGISVNRVQDNYVTQWGDPNYDNPEATGEAKKLPEGLKVMGEAEYTASLDEWQNRNAERNRARQDKEAAGLVLRPAETAPYPAWLSTDAYANNVNFYDGWPVATVWRDSFPQQWWPVHCYGMVGVGRNYSPDTGSGAELYTVIGHAPRHLDRNIALVGRVIEGMEHLSSLPRGKGELGFYAEDEFDKRTPILTVRVASDHAATDTASSSEAVGQQTRPRFEYLSTEGETFARYAEARANRRDPFFIAPAGGADICNIPVPVRRVAE
ncbi:peptidylprolyl isomerase [Altererythrobacter sp. H2]|uniref:peptidylprolyl isomerase n=1 Tax=Altererythrobacter sp. H2 TaxID=3108391 RepID=UPI002B4BEAC7|nr:peptidylprolyl isomerase [Altererythrobacter sp. H2]WRK95278.1 peptidylprolyl isomerase [Altererythrobacter sp. H2]